MKHKSRLSLGLAIFLAGLLIVVLVVPVFALPTPQASVSRSAWDPSIPGWTIAGDQGYWEGETAVMAAIISDQMGNTWDLTLCLDVWTPNPPTPPYAYGFTAFEPFDTTTRAPNLPPPTLPGGEAINYAFPAPWDTGDPNVYGYNITINSVSAPVVGAPCNANALGVVVNYTPQTNANAYIVWGGHIASTGDPLPAGSPDATVPAGMSAGFVATVFEARIKTDGADRNLIFKVLFGPTAITLRSFEASAAVPAGLALVTALSGLGVTGLLLRRRHK
jgi:hypothetical protein